MHNLHRQAIFTTFIVLMVSGLLSIASPASAVLEVSEGGLNPAGSAYEVNPDSFGRLWISDFGAGEIWSINPNGAVPGTWDYTRYILPDDTTPDGPNPTDARRVGDYFYWADYDTGDLGRSTEGGVYQKWSFPEINGFNGTAVDVNGNLWATDANNAFLYRLDPDALPNGEICTFTLPDFASSYYLLVQGGYLYFGDDTNARMLRLAITDSDVAWQLEWWDLPLGSSPLGLAADGDGHIWYVDSGTTNQFLGELNPSLDTLRLFSIPMGDLPAVATVQNGLVWYTERELIGGSNSIGGIGMLDPATAAYTSPEITYGDLTQNPSCHPVTTQPAQDLQIIEGSYNWETTGYYFLVSKAGGWQIFQMTTDAFPWGIASLDGTVYVVDNGRQKLLKVGINDNPPFSYLFLPMIQR